MSVQKSQYPNQSAMTESEKLIIIQCRRMCDEARKFPDICSQCEPIDAVVQCLEELAMVQEFRRSKYNYRLDKLKTLKNRFNKTFK